MKIGILIKQVPDTESKIQLEETLLSIKENGLKFVVSPYDELAIEEALKTKEKMTGSETVVVTLGPERSVEALRTGLAMGVDKAVHVESENLSYDSYQTAQILGKVCQDQAFDLIFCGKQAIDDDNAQVVQMIGELLNMPHILLVDQCDIQESQGCFHRRASGGTKEVIQTTFPCIVGCDMGLNKPRYASLPGIMKAKSKPIEKIKASDLLNGETALIKWSRLSLPVERSAGKKIEGEPEVQATELIRLLIEEAKVL